METGAITGYIDVAQVVLYAFWAFFAALILYLRREDKREGYPLQSDRSERAPRVPIIGFPAPPSPKVFRMPHGEGNFEAPRAEPHAGDIPGTQKGPMPHPGDPLRPSGNPMRDGVGPGSYALRAEHPDWTIDGQPKVVPMRVATDFEVVDEDPDPRGMEVVGADGVVAGTVSDVWVDRAEPRILFFEVDLASGGGEGEGAQTVLLPIGFSRFQIKANRIRVASILAEQFADVPRLSNPDQVTRREEDQITAYYASGHLYATPERQEPLI